jgi:uncharacterized protein with von Willebrand factor type A (vWA) domain
MVPFHNLSDQLVETANRGRVSSLTSAYFFHDYPDYFVFSDRERRKPVPLAHLLADLPQRTAVLILSDAGAARGHLDETRYRQTLHFLSKVRQQRLRYLAWLNPMPHHRWPATTASLIARDVPMFELSSRGMTSALATLRGSYVNWKYPWML